MSFPRFTMLALLAVPLAAQDARPNLSGSYHLKGATKTATAMTIVIEHKGSAIHVIKTVTGADGKEVKSEYRCTTDGKECESAGTKISLWFDGPSLVEMDAGEAISKNVMKFSGNSLTIEVTHIVPDGEAETFVLEKI